MCISHLRQRQAIPDGVATLERQAIPGGVELYHYDVLDYYVTLFDMLFSEPLLNEIGLGHMVTCNLSLILEADNIHSRSTTMHYHRCSVKIKVKAIHDTIESCRPYSAFCLFILVAVSPPPNHAGPLHTHAPHSHIGSWHATHPSCTLALV